MFTPPYSLENFGAYSLRPPLPFKPGSFSFPGTSNSFLSLKPELQGALLEDQCLSALTASWNPRELGHPQRC